MPRAAIPVVAFIAGTLAMIGAVVLVAIGKPVPIELWAFATAAIAGALGNAIPTPSVQSGGTVTTTTTGTPVGTTTVKVPGPPVQDTHR